MSLSSPPDAFYVPPVAPVPTAPRSIAVIPPPPVIAGMEMTDWRRKIANALATAVSGIVAGAFAFGLAKVPFIAPYVAGYEGRAEAAVATIVAGWVNGLLTRSPFDNSRMAPIKDARDNGKILVAAAKQN